MERLIEPEVLLLSNRIDYTTDHISFRLHEMGVPYLRLNRDQFTEMRLELIPDAPVLNGKSTSLRFHVHGDRLRSVYFRAPVFLRDNYQPGLSADEQFARSQWAAFIRSLTVFDTAFWLNHPEATYQAEVKPFQLRIAKSVGFKIPNTVVTNSATPDGVKHRWLATKVLDTTVLRIGEREGFIYTQIVERDELASGDLSAAPVIVQQAMIPKVDLRVTVVGDEVFPVKIIDSDGDGIADDWRLNKDGLQYVPVELPVKVRSQCVDLIRQLRLTFGGIDLIVHNDEYYFIEVNPTGEWAWLLSHTDYPIDTSIAALLAASR